MKELIQLFKEKEVEIKKWLETYREPLGDPMYASVDLRNAGFKISPVDTNIFPGGWNNICPKSRRDAADRLKAYVDRCHPGTKKILILPEHHTRNAYYLSNLAKLHEIAERTGLEVKIGNFNPENTEDILELETSEGEKVTEYKVTRKDDMLVIGDWEADIYILNNDLSGGIPEILQGLKKPLIPTPTGGWHTRIKSDHFHYYQILVTMFAEEFNVDPWLMNPYFDHAEDVDFSSAESLKIIADKVDTLIEKISEKYKEYGIPDKPFVFIKNESGTYGMGVTTVESGEDVIAFNRDERKRMSTGKDKVKITKVILQEGIPTVEKLEDNIAEPVLYMVDSHIVGGFFRIHSEKTDRENLNSPGMTFTKMCMHDLRNYSNAYNSAISASDMLPIYKVIAELASIATGYELIGLQINKSVL
ncbi:glutamate--cysteine ligase [Candidatus Gracilibacteria bacterium]|nr:glutamate--cysteine ligase [Candidatus Gracilibacteria bacterium]